SSYSDNNASLVGSGTGFFNVTINSTNGTVILEINNTNVTATNYSSSPSMFNASYDFTSNGTYSYWWHAWGNGTGENYNVSLIRSYTVNDSETVSPELVINYPPNNSRYNETAIVFNVSGNENLTECRLSINGNDNVTMTKYNDTWYNYTNTSIASGEYSFIINCNDTANNWNVTDTYYFTVDTVYPDINFTDPTSSTGSQSNTDIFVNVSVSDSETNVSTFIDWDGSLLAWYRMDDYNGSDVLDYLGLNNGTWSNNVTRGEGEDENNGQTDSGQLGKAWMFDGDGDYINLGSDDRLDINTENFTFSAWAKLESKGTDHEIVVKGWSNAGIDLRWDEGNDAFAWSIYDSAWRQIYHQTSPVTLGVWYHVVGVRNGTISEIYVNGIKGDTTGTIGTIGDVSNYNLTIGKIGDSDERFWNGSIDDVMIFNRSFSAEEIYALYANQSSRYLEINFTNLAEETHTFKAYTQDYGGNVNSTEQRTITIDLDIPIFFNYWDNNASLVESGTGFFNVSVNMTNGTVILEMNNINITATNYSSSPSMFNASYDFTSNGDYSYWWHSWGNGTGENYNVSSIQSYTVNASEIPPNLTILSPTNDTYNVSYINFNISSDENLSLCVFSLDAFENNYTMNLNSSLTGANYTNTSIADGAFLAQFWCNDTSGNANGTENVAFSIAVPPQFNNTQANQTSALNGETINFSTDVTDNSLVDSIWLQHNFEPTVTEIQEQTSGNLEMGFGAGRLAAQSLQGVGGKVINGSINLKATTKSPTTFGDVLVEIRTDESNLPSSTVLASATISSFTSSTATDYFFNFTTPAEITEGITYWLVLSSSGSSRQDTYSWMYSSSNPYINGSRAYNIGNWKSVPSDDQRFHLEIANFSYKNETPLTISSASSPASFVKTLEWAGIYYWNFCANDSSNNENCSSLSGVYVYEASDTIVQNISWLSYPSGRINGEQIKFSGYVQDDSMSRNLSLWMKNGTDPWQLLYTNTTIGTTIYLDYNFNSTPYENEANITFQLLGYDTAGNSNQTNVTNEVDHSAPQLSLSPATNPWITPDYSWYKNGDVITLRINVTDDSGIDFVEVNLSNINGSGQMNMTLESGSASAGEYSTWSLTSTINTTSEENKEIGILVADTAIPSKNINLIFGEYKVDNDAPSYSSLSTYPEITYKGLNVTHQIYWTDTLSSLDTCILSTNASGTFENYTEALSGEDDWCSLSVNYTSNGTYSYIFYANDSVNNWNNTGYQDIAILTEPVNTTEVHLIYPQNNTVFSINTINVTVNATNLTQDELDSCWITIAGIPNVTNNTMLINTNTNLTLTNIEEGNNYVFDACCNNTDGIESCSIEGGIYGINFSSSPTLTIKVPANNSRYNETDIIFNVSGSETLTYCGLSINENTNATMTKYNDTWYNYTNNSIASGEHSFIISCNDSYNNWGYSETYYFLVDKTFPDINFTDPTSSNDSSQENTDIFVNVSVNDSTNISTFIDFNNKLLGWWTMDIYNGSDVIEYKGRNNGSVTGALQTDAGQLGKAFEFDGETDYLNLGNNDLEISDNFTISLWIRTNDSSGTPTIIGRVDSGGAYSQYWYLGKGNGVSTIETGLGDNSKYSTVYSNDGITDNKWHQVVWVRKDDIQEIYVDGANSTNPSSIDSGIGNVNPPTNVYIGGDVESNDYYFNGSIDDVLIFNRTLSITEIQALYTNQSSRYLEITFANLVNGNYRFKAYTQDYGGNINETEEREVTISSIAPKINFTYPTPTNDTTTSNTSIEINVSIVESNLDEVIYNWNKTNYTLYND
ncbi:hypothetical protein AC477_05230, partial [miscellaneous Crenarchaeota group-1 archaeon SG8-32-1]